MVVRFQAGVLTYGRILTRDLQLPMAHNPQAKSALEAWGHMESMVELEVFQASTNFVVMTFLDPTTL